MARRTLTDRQAFKMRWLYMNTPLSMKQIGDRFSMQKHSVLSIIRGRTYRTVAFPKRRKAKPHGTELRATCLLRPDQVRSIRRASKWRTQAELAALYGVGVSTIQNLLAGRTYKKVK